MRGIGIRGAGMIPVSMQGGGQGADVIKPTVLITCPSGNPTATSPLAITITFSEDVIGFVVGDITAVGFTLTDFTAVSGAVYTVNAAFSAGSGTLDIAAGVCADAAGNTNEAAAQFNRSYLYTLTLQPAGVAGIDTYMAPAAPDTNYGTDTTFVVRSGRSSLIKFDLSSIPAGSTFVSAVLSLYLGGNATADNTVTFNRVLPADSTWTELGATWNHTDGANHWAGDAATDGGADAGCSVSGTDYAATAIGSLAIVNGHLNGREYNVALNLTEFALMVANNSGLTGRGTGSQTIGLYSSDVATPGYRPRLVVTYTKAGGPDPEAAVLDVYAIGDSITAGVNDEVDALGYPGHLSAIYEALGGYTSTEERCAVGGWTIEDAQAAIDADLAATVITPKIVIVHIGANDIYIVGLNEADWKADFNYVLDAVHTKWASARIYISRTYRSGEMVAIEALWQWQLDIIAARPAYCFVGIDTEPIFEGHPELMDGGVPGVHPNCAGFQAMAAAWDALIVL